MTARDTDRDAEIARQFQYGLSPSELATLFGVQPPAICKALRRQGIRIAPARGPNPKPRRTQAEIRAATVPAVVDREPCPSCGIRADIGCRHRRAA